MPQASDQFDHKGLGWNPEPLLQKADRQCVTKQQNNRSSTMAAVAATPVEPSTTNKASRQIPIVCPGHTRPLAELQFRQVEDETFLISACHDRLPMVRDGSSGDWIGTFSGHKGAVWSCRMDPKGLLAATASGDFSVKVRAGYCTRSL